MDAAWKPFAQHGPEVSLRAVAHEADVGIATLYRHFPTKEDLVLGLYDEIGRRIEEIVRRHDSGWDTDPRSAWKAFVHDVASLEIGALAYRMSPLAQSSPHLAEAVESRRRATIDALDRSLDRAKTAGVLDKKVSVFRFFAGLAAITRPLPPHVEASLPGQCQWLVDTYIAGLDGIGNRR